MKSYLATLIATFGILLLAAWAIVVFDYRDVAPLEYQMEIAHADFISSCNLGDLDFIGDSTATADILPFRIGPGVRALGLGGGTPVEGYYVVKSLLKCRNRPKAVVLSYLPSSFGNNPGYPDPTGSFFLSRAFLNEAVNFPDAMAILKGSRQLKDPLYTGSGSLFDLDYTVAAFGYAVRFPPYFMPELQPYFHAVLRGRERASHAANLAFYQQTVLDDGHHFFGMDPDGYGANGIDHDSYRADIAIAPLADRYFRRTIAALNAAGIKVFVMEPPRDQIAVAHYNPDLISVYQGYLMKVQSGEANVGLIGNGFQVWDPIYFGDGSHLNLRGSSILSENLRQQIIALNLPVATYSNDDLKPDNLVAAGDAGTAFWTDPANAGDSIAPAGDVALPELAYPAEDTVWLYDVQAQQDGSSRVQAPSVDLAANTPYAVAVLIKNVSADGVGLQMKWPGGEVGKINWDFVRQQESYSGAANTVNSGIVFCPDGWVELFLSGATGPASGNSPGPVVTLSAKHDAAAYVYNLTLEHGLWPRNYCKLQPGQVKTVLPIAAGSSAAN